MVKKDSFPSDFSRHVIEKYARVPENKDERIMGSILDLFFYSDQWGKNSLKSFLEKVATIMQQQLFFMEMSISLKDRSDGIFRYKLIKGFSREATDSQMKMEYTQEEMFDEIKFPTLKFGRNIIALSSALYDQEVEELKTYTAPSLIETPRKSIDNMTEADYFSAYLYGGERELIGFMEFSKTPDRKLPSRITIKWVELLCVIVGQIIWEKEYSN